MTDPFAAAWPEMSGYGEAILFWTTASLMVVAALGLLVFKKAAYAVLSMVAVMVGMAVMFFALQAPFNGMVQIIVYTGAILMLFLFVIMMIGLGATDGFSRQPRGYIIAAVLGGAGLAALLVSAVFMSRVPGPGKFDWDPYSNLPVTALAVRLFQEHWLTIQVVAILLITAAVGAVLLTHSDRLGPKLNQKSVARARMEALARRGHHVGQLPAPGVYATTNSVDNPAIAGDTLQAAPGSVPRVLLVKGLDKPLGQVSPGVAQSLQLARTEGRENSSWGAPKVVQSKAWGMAGEGAPTGLQQVRAGDIEGEK